MTDIQSAIKQAGSLRGAARLLEIPWSTFKSRYKKLPDCEKKGNISINGIMPTFSDADPERMLEELIAKQGKKEAHIALSRSQRIKVDDDKPFVIALFSDLHIGNNKTDYRSLKEDSLLVRDCPFCYGIAAGDYSDNWIGKLGWISREQHMSIDAEHALTRWWFDTVSSSLIAVVAGNHDNRTQLAAGVDFIRSILGDAVLLYDMDQVLFTLETPAAEIVFKVRHKDMYKSVLNPFHGGMRDVERGDCPWDVYISGHSHQATLFGEYIHHDKKKLVCRIGTYKMGDRYGLFHGFPKSFGNGSGAIIVMPDGELAHFSSIANAIQCCSAMR